MLELTVEGMSCSHCIAAVKRAIAGLDPTATVDVDLTAGRVRIDGKVDRDAAAAAIRETGYEVKAG